MVFLPLIQRELGLRARRKNSYWRRVAVGAGGVLICLPTLLSPDISGTPSRAGIAVFNSLVAIGFILAFMACFSTADAISSEKREGTLGLLFLTRVKWTDVIAGKLVSNGIVNLAALLILMPFLMIPVLAGGITGGEVLRKALALLNILFFTLSVGMYISSWAFEKYKAVRRTVVLAVLILLAPLVIEAMLKSVRAGTGFGLLSPATALFLAGDTEYRTRPSPYWICLGIGHLMAWIGLLGATLNLRSTGHTETPIEVQFSSSALSQNQSSGRGWLKAREKLAPVEWLVRRQRGLRTLLWLGAAADVFNHLFFRLLSGWRSPPTGSFLLAYTYSLPNLFFGCLSGAFFAWAASRFLIETRRSGESELLLTTPIGATTLVRDQWKALRDRLVWPLVACLMGVLLPSLFGMLRLYGSQPTFVGPYIIGIAFGTFNLFLSIFAVCWVSFWFGMKAPRQSGAIVQTLAVVKGGPYLLSIVWVLLMQGLLMGVLGPLRSSLRTPFYATSYIPNVLTLLYYFWIIRLAQRRLRTGSSTSISTPLIDVKKFVSNIRSWKAT